MSLLTFVLIVVLVGVALYLINRYIPMAGGVKSFLNVAVVIILIVWLLKILGVISYLGSVKIK